MQDTGTQQKPEHRKERAIHGRDSRGGGSGDIFPTTSISRPTPTKDTILSIEPILDRSIKNSLAMTTARSAAPTSQTTRLRWRAAMSMVNRASSVQNKEREV